MGSAKPKKYKLNEYVDVLEDSVMQFRRCQQNTAGGAWTAAAAVVVFIIQCVRV